MARTIAPKATMYAETRFRSRLEARWAAYFDGIKLAWEYEPKTFKLRCFDGEVIYYIPDFWLPTEETWVEVKPAPFQSTSELGAGEENVSVLPHEEFHKLSVFNYNAEERGKNRLYVTNGVPNYLKMREGTLFYGFHGSEDDYDPIDVICGTCALCQRPFFTIPRWGPCKGCNKKLVVDASVIMRICSQVKDMKFKNARD